MPGHTDRYRVMVVGGQGFFGSRLVERLARHANLHIIVVGRSLHDTTPAGAAAQFSHIEVDAMSGAFDEVLQALRPSAVVHCAGPFQGQDYRVARACIRNGAHYVDLADAREFVAGIASLHALAQAENVFVTSGASSVPALSSAVADQLARELDEMHFIDIGISPANRTERGLGAVRAILAYCGKPLAVPSGNEPVGWATTYSHEYSAPVGARLLSPCDVPDLALLALRYAGTPAVRFGAGLELRFLHRGMNVLARLAQHGLVRDWSVHARILKRISDWFRHMGTDAGAMHVTASGLRHGVPMTHGWQLLATHGDGPFVPVLAACVLVRRLAADETLPAGAFPCMGLVSLDELMQEAAGLHITTRFT